LEKVASSADHRIDLPLVPAALKGWYDVLGGSEDGSRRSVSGSRRTSRTKPLFSHCLLQQGGPMAQITTGGCRLRSTSC
jgi:hypothetical protein